MNFILFTGHSCTGKTTISKRLEAEHGYSFISIHSFISEIARKRGHSRGREFFKKEGVNQVSHILSNYLCNYLKKCNFEKVVIDDIYDNDLLDRFYSCFPEGKTILIALKSKNNNRLNRMSERISVEIDTAKDELKLYDTFKIEAGIEKVIERADFNISNENVSIDELYKNVTNILNQQI